MKKLFTGLLILAFVSLNFATLHAQETPQKPKYMVWEVQVNPIQLQKMQQALKSQNAFLAEQNYPFANLTQYTNDGYLWYSVPFTNYADIDKIEATSQKLWKENGEKSKELQALFEESFTSIAGLILELQPELSIIPEQTSIRTGQKFRFFEQFHIKYGKEKEFEELVKQYISLRKKHGIENGFYTLYPVFAPAMNVVYFIDETGSGAAEHFSENDKQWQMFGAEGEKLWNDVMPLIEKIVTHLGAVDYDVSYVPNN
ncbi:hypothetical protein SLH46_12255 [Draconibacterium sp. IB214405]|uniref:hypothetical protein n=1 Tax=Draconibacterium sp. IB214405 TaxID=3097352 RepID=UPI002A166022|nr:hypothetical protein [Draconibacterium sp. IB214405]MDX8339963.1 hypothetical protein [Draconibacterium sp. IB214405]